jgi:hypothetical protein
MNNSILPGNQAEKLPYQKENWYTPKNLQNKNVFI